MFVRTDDGKMKDVELDKVTKDNYIVPEGEKMCFHVIMEIKQYHPKTGDKISRPRLQKFKAGTFKQLRPNFERQGYDINVLYDPTEYIKEVGEKAEQAKEKAAQMRIETAVKSALAKQEADFQKRIDEAVAAALAKNQQPKEKTEKQHSKG